MQHCTIAVSLNLFYLLVVRSLHVETTEWEFLKNVGVALGVPSESLLKEDKATNTFENVRFSLEVLQQQGIHPKKVVLVHSND
ncbi:hypothetical protein BK119_07790 [Paenibacillus peoriae]|nr:hypothetical protein BK119_07790 [Paenibacillus peoriae]